MPQIFFNEVSTAPDIFLNGGQNFNVERNSINYTFINIIKNIYKIFPILYNLILSIIKALSVVFTIDNIVSYIFPWILFVTFTLFLFRRFVYRSKEPIKKSNNDDDLSLIEELYTRYERLDNQWQNKY